MFENSSPNVDLLKLLVKTIKFIFSCLSSVCIFILGIEKVTNYYDIFNFSI